MLRLLPVAFLLFLLPACTRSAEDSCTIVCDMSALCQPGSDVTTCNSICVDLAADDEAYTEAIAAQADCYDDNASYYEHKPKDVCIAISAGVCQVEP